MLHKILLLAALSLAVSITQADTVKLNPDHPDSYVVVKGDTLWDIAGRFLQEPWRWPEIWKVNPQIENPHWIYPGDVVSLKFEGGEPVLSVDRGAEAAGGERESAVAASGMPASREVKLSPEIRVHPREKAIPSIPIEAIRHFLTRPLVINEDETDNWPYIVAGRNNHIIAGKGDTVYVRGLSGGDNTKRYSIYRKGAAYKSNGKVLGYEALHIADAVVIRDGDPAVVKIVQSDREVEEGDRLMPQSEREITSDFIPQPPDNNINGSIIAAVDTVFAIGRYQIVILDRGATDGLKVGNVLGIYGEKGTVVTDKIASEKTDALNKTRLMQYLGPFKGPDKKIKLPEDLSGVLMVFRTFDRLSYGIVMEAYEPMHIDDTVKNL